MNTLEINRVLEKNPLTRQTYIGCFAADQIPVNIRTNFPFCMVVNLDPSDSRGSHWVSIYCEKPDYLEYYDPLGLWPPPSSFIINYLSLFDHVKYNKTSFQSPYSRACGRHAIFFLYNRCNGVTFDKIVHFLHGAKSAPDRIVNEFIRNSLFSKHV